MVKSVAKRKKRDPLHQDAVKALRELSPPKRLAVEAVLHSATRPLALDKLIRAGVEIDLPTLHNWCRSPVFIRALKAREIELAAQITKESIINNAKNLLDLAVEGEPIVSRDKKTGESEIIGYKPALGAALTANEQMGKVIGAFNADHSGKVAVVIDIDFSGRKDPVRETVIEDAEYTAVEPQADAGGAALKPPDPPEMAEWLQ